MTAASARIVAAVSAEASSTAHPTVCAVWSSAARPLLITVACMCVILKGLVSVYFRCPAAGFSETHRGGFRHVQHVRPNRGPHKKGAPTKAQFFFIFYNMVTSQKY